MKPSIPKGTRDFSSTEVANRTYIINTMKTAFETFGFQPIETPSFENSTTLMGKYGEEGDRLIFKILNSGDYLGKFSLFFIVKTKRLIQDYYKHKLNSNLELTIDSFKELFLHSKILIGSYNGIDSKKIFNDNFFDSLFNFLNNNLFNIENEFQDIFKFHKIVTSFFSIWLVDNSVLFENCISEKALRYDLTVPFARYVVQHQNDITFPFKRYQIQSVWRADRPQKGRFREFFQCDADVVGSKSLLQEVDFIQLYDTVFTNLKLIGTTIKINNRKILAGIAEVIGAKDKLIDFTVALDKLDKIGSSGVEKEMLQKGISIEAIKKVTPLFDLSGSNTDQLNVLEKLLSESEEGKKGVEELRFVVNTINNLGLQSASLEIDVTLARGLNYYTGAIFEVSAPNGVQMGSIGGGGRYDDLTGIFGLKDVSGVGISFGLDRIYLVLEELGLFDAVSLPKPKLLFLNFNEEDNNTQLEAIKALRNVGVKTEIYPDTASSNKQQKKQWKYVSTRNIAFVISEIQNNTFKLKDMSDGSQMVCTLDELINKMQ